MGLIPLKTGRQRPRQARGHGAHPIKDRDAEAQGGKGAWGSSH